ncbi:alpha/beta fold hydrolase [Sphingomonas jatrophae]|uniref:Polyhydroxyalkanoate synthase n=1 Tax=Sphingomonas jatrophae TaxID=1166337 RepID=A0A1I6LJR6_9SPHN|nr:alpha/beta fold hydrolase [Sphingomonas jatrophae]SFS03562.1 polyhydroxyalkanoate synthase [Sphingomonas jatrophae]
MSDTARPAAVAQWSEAMQRAGAAMLSLAKSPPTPAASRPWDPAPILQSMLGAMADWASRPQDLFKLQTQAMGEWADFWAATFRGQGAEQPIARGDRRFTDPQWAEDPAYRTLRDAYLLASRQLRQLNDQTAGEGPGKTMLNFLVESYLNAVAPSNFPLTNPEAARRTVETGGANLVAGFANLLEDAASGRGIVRRRTDPDAFKKGETIAATPGSVVFQNRLFQLIQYDPTTPDVAAEPMLYVPPLVNRYYMIDLKPKASMVRWLVEQGRTVFVISWVNPGEAQRDADVSAYVTEGVIEALGAVERATGRTGTDLFGFCLGGTLIAIALAYLAAKGEAERANSATLIGSMVDFGDMRDWSAFVHEAHLDALDEHTAKRGYIHADELQQLFSAVRANDLIWSSVVNHYLLDRPAPPSDLLYWFEDGARIPAAFLKSYNRELLYNNRLREPAAFKVVDVPIDLGAIRTPILSIALKDDHVSAWDAVYRGARLFGGDVTFLLGGSGHNAGVINPPAANKHGFWRNPDMPESADEWLAGAEKLPGSWWPTWNEWLGAHGSAERVPAREVGEGALPAIEPAPGSYALADQ